MKSLKEDLEAAKAQGFDTSEKHYHWSPAGEAIGSFAPFSHFGTAKAAHDRYLQPLGMKDATVGNLKDRREKPPAEGQTIPVHINKSKVLHLDSDTGSHDPVQLAHSIRQAADNHATISVSHHVDAHNVLNHILDNWSDDDMKKWADKNDAGYWTSEFDHEHHSETRDMWHEEIHHRVFQDPHTGDHDPDQPPDTAHTREIAEINPEATKAAFEHIQKHLDNAGVTALSYKNDVEDPGSTSWIVPNPKHVRSVHAKFKNPQGTDLMEEMMGVSAIAGIGAGGEPNNPNLSFKDEPGRNMRLLSFRRMLARKRAIW